MSKEPEIRNTYKIHENGKIGEVQIADEVVAVIAGLAAILFPVKEGEGEESGA